MSDPEPSPSSEPGWFAPRLSVEQVEEGLLLAPKFDAHGLLPVITTAARTGDVLILGFMNREALERTLATAEMHCWSRSRGALWRKGETSGLKQRLVEPLVDDDQDALLARSRSQAPARAAMSATACFYRRVAVLGQSDARPLAPAFTEDAKTFDRQTVYAGQPNPTVL